MASICVIAELRIRALFGIKQVISTVSWMSTVSNAAARAVCETAVFTWRASSCWSCRVAHHFVARVLRTQLSADRGGSIASANCDRGQQNLWRELDASQQEMYYCAAGSQAGQMAASQLLDCGWQRSATLLRRGNTTANLRSDYGACLRRRKVEGRRRRGMIAQKMPKTSASSLWTTLVVSPRRKPLNFSNDMQASVRAG